jgi:paraquat-inducible protein A
VSAPAVPTPQVCRRCAGQFSLPHKTRLPSCPHCGAAIIPLHRRLRDNRLAAVLALLAAITLASSLFFPFIAITQLNDTHAYSLLGGIRELFDRGNIFLGALLLTFSVIFPFAKLLSILFATSRLVQISAKARHRLHTLASVTGRYSLLDILVIAIMIVVIRFDGLVEAHARPGTYLFALAVFLSIGSGLCVNLEKPNE